MVLLSKPAWQKPGCCFKHHIHTIINTNLQSARLISSQIRRYLPEGNAGCDEGIPFWMCFYSHTGRDRVKAPVPHARCCPALQPLWVLEPVYGTQRAWMLPAPCPALPVQHSSLSCLVHNPFQEQKISIFCMAAPREERAWHAHL